MALFTIRNKLRGLLLITVITAASVIFTLYSDRTAKYTADALRTCALAVIPSLFPFMVLSSLAAKIAPHLTDGSSTKAATVLSVILGSLCGFPVGASTVAAMYKNGALQKSDAEMLCGLCNNTGPAFVIGVIGQCFWGDKLLGIMFYICQIVSAFVIFSICRIFFSIRNHRKKKESDSAFYNNAENAGNIRNRTIPSEIPRVFCSSVTDSAVSVIAICGYVVFFKVICDTIRCFMPDSAASDIVYSVIACILEFTSGTQNAANLGGVPGVTLCAFSTSFSGISVMAQSTGILTKVGLSARPMFVMKLLAGIISVPLSYIFFKLFNFGNTVTVGAYIPVRNSMLYLSVCIIVFSIILSFSERIFAKR